MHNLERRIAYAQQRYGIDAIAAAHMVQQHIQAGTADSLLTPAQYQRVRAHRFDGTLLRMNRQQRAEAREVRRLRRTAWMWDVLNPRGPALRRELKIDPPPYGELYGDATPESALAEHEEMLAALGSPKPFWSRKAGKNRVSLAIEKRARRAGLRMTYASRRGD